MKTPRSSVSLRRSLLFMPGDSLRKITKAAQLDVDSIIMDLEDAVAPNRKDDARRIAAEALGTIDFGSRERLVRLNGPETGLISDDLQSTIDGRPDGYVVPKVETAGQLQAVDQSLTEFEARNSWSSGAVRLLAIIETALGVMNLAEIAQASPRLEALMIGAEDLASDIGAKRTRAGWEVFYARSGLVTAAAAYRLQAIDTVFIDLNDLTGLKNECISGRQLGFDGKMAIHPRQLATINQAFSPSPEEISQAKRLVTAYELNAASGTGAFDFEGKMVDMPIVRAAEQLLEQAKLAGLENDG